MLCNVICHVLIIIQPEYRYFIKKSVVSSTPIHSSYAKHMQKNIQWVK